MFAPRFFASAAVPLLVIAGSYDVVVDYRRHALATFGIVPDETVVLMALSIPVGLYVILRQGIYLPGLPIVAAGLVLFTWAALSWGWSPSRILAARTLSYLFTFSLWCLIVGALVIAPSRAIPLGAGVFDPAVYPEVEKAMGEEIARYVPGKN